MAHVEAFRIDKAGTAFSPLWGGEPFVGRYTIISTASMGGKTYLIGYSSDGACDLLLTRGEDPPSLVKSVRLPADLSWVESFTLANRVFVLCYTAQSGQLAIVELLSDLSFSQAYTYRRYVEPGETAGFTTIRVLLWNNSPFIMGYNIQTGRVALYSISATATSSEGFPPLVIHNTWSWLWARGWTRFAFFRMGGEVFFLKTNIDHPNVNIDHVLDGLSGTMEVATRMELRDAQSLTAVAPVTLADSSPGFIAYKGSGETVLYRVKTDCTGWIPYVESKLCAGRTSLTVLAIGDMSVLLFY